MLGTLRRGILAGAERFVKLYAFSRVIQGPEKVDLVPCAVSIPLLLRAAGYCLPAKK